MSPIFYRRWFGNGNEFLGHGDIRPERVSWAIGGKEKVRGRGIGSHTRPNKGEHVIYLTPPSILANLGIFDLDPCSAPSPRPWPTALRHVELPEDGLSVEWAGRVWLNPPYDEGLDNWLEKMAKHGAGMALLFARTEIESWQKFIWPYAKAVLFIAGRLYFYLPDGSRMPGNAGGPSALIAYSANDADYLWNSGIRGAFVEIKTLGLPTSR